MDLNALITQINDAVWGYVLIFVLVGCGVWFTFKTRFVQFRMVGEMLRLLTDSAVDTVEEQVKEQRQGGRSKHISSFQAFAVSVATRVGTGNLARVNIGAIVQAEAQGFVYRRSCLLYPTRTASALDGHFVRYPHHLSVWIVE